MTRKSCILCQEGDISYKDVLRLKRFLTRRGKLKPRKRTGLCARHQRQAAKEVKKARLLGLLPFVKK